MGESDTGDESPSSHRLTVPEAARALGITESAIRGRIKRKTLRSYREAGAVYVVLQGDEPPPSRDEPSGESSDQSELVAVLREQLQAERQAHAEARRLLMAALERIPPQIEAPRESPVPTEDTPEGAEPRPATGGTQEGVQRPHSEVPRSWWRRIIGG